MKQILRAGVVATLMFATVALFAQDGGFGGNNFRRGGNREFGRQGGRPGGRGFNMQRFNPRAEAEKKLKEQFPAEFAEIEKLRAEAEEKLKALAKKANIELPEAPKSMEERMADLKKKYPKEMEEIEALRKTDPRASFMKLRELMMKENGGKMPGGENRPAMRDNPQKILRDAQKKYPEDWKEIQRIRRTDPAKARQMTRALIEKFKKEGNK